MQTHTTSCLLARTMNPFATLVCIAGCLQALAEPNSKPRVELKTQNGDMLLDSNGTGCVMIMIT